MKILVCAGGTGAGEASLASPAIKALSRCGHSLQIIVDSQRNAGIIQDPRVQIMDWQTAWWVSIPPQNIEVIVAASSITCGTLFPYLSQHFPHTPIISLEFSWIPWYQEALHGSVDEFLMQFPEPVFQAGLLGNGGDFVIPPAAVEKFKAKGWFYPFQPLSPEIRRLARTQAGIKEDEKLILMYPSRENGFEVVRPSLEKALKLLAESLGYKPVVLMANTTNSWSDLAHPLSWMKLQEFRELCGAADLVVGAGFCATASYALRAQVPAVIWSLPWDTPHHPWGWGEREAYAAWNAGLVQRLAGPAPASSIASALKAGLTDTVMRREQLKAASDPADGLAYLVERVEQLVQTRSYKRLPEATTQLTEAIAARQAGRLTEARVTLEAMLTAGSMEAAPFLELGELCMELQQWDKAVQCLKAAFSTPLFTGLEPIRLFKAELLLLQALQHYGLYLRHAGRLDEAEQVFSEAVQQAAELFKRFGGQLTLAHDLLAVASNHFKTERMGRAVEDLGRFLIDNDEPAKVLDLLKAVPHTLEAHPRISRLDQWADQIRTHMQNKSAYLAFYNDKNATGSIPSSPQWLAPTSCMPRATWVMDTIRRTGARRILDIGSNDGIIAIPILRSFPTLDYTAVEASAEVQGWLKANLAQFKLDATVQDTLPDGCFDLIICFELIEHVPDPVEFLKTLAARLNPKGLLLLTTPYGSFDAGHPPALTAHGTPRDSRSHLRAFTIKTLVEAIEAGGLIPLELSRMPTVSGRMEGMHAAAILPEGRKPQGPAFIVPFAMWKWNASVVREQGMGGSEEMIVELSAAMARDYQPVEVFGPVADPEVKDQVYFWPKEQLSSLRNSPDRVIVAVREPGIGPGIQALAPDSKRFLWLQDTIYPELNPQSASFFNRIIATTHWHKNHLCTSYSLDLQQVKVIPNFLMADHFTETNIQRQPYHFVYASSPDRGLLTLLELWPRILERWPEASLDIFYGWRGIETLGCHPQNAKAVATLHHFCSEKMQQKGICERGMVNARTLARELQRASIWAYPTAFEEAFCITAIKARAAGCIPVTSRLAALTETAACSQAILLPPAAETGEEVYAEAFIEGIEQALQTTSLQRQQMQEEAIEQFRYERALLRWRQVLWGKS